MDRTLIILSEMGDIELNWDSKHDDEIKTLIEKKMAAGMIFFVIKPVLGFIPMKKKLTANWSDGQVNPDDLKTRRISVKDEHIEELFSAGKLKLSRSEETKFETVRKAKDAADVVANRCMGTRALAGG
jgi:hypothetical protein